MKVNLYKLYSDYFVFQDKYDSIVDLYEIDIIYFEKKNKLLGADWISDKISIPKLSYFGKNIKIPIKPISKMFNSKLLVRES